MTKKLQLATINAGEERMTYFQQAGNLRLLILVSLFFFSSQQPLISAIYWTLDHGQDISRLKQAGFAHGYNVKQIQGWAEIRELDPESDSLLIFNASEKHPNLAIHVSDFIEGGGRAAWIVNNISSEARELNDILSQRFGIMIDVQSSAATAGSTYQGEDIFPLWKGLFLGISESMNRNILQIDKTKAVPLSFRRAGGNQVTTSAYSTRGKGDIIFICSPGRRKRNLKIGFFSDNVLDQYDNRQALTRLLEWLSGEADLGVETRLDRPAGVINDRQLELLNRLIRSAAIDPESRQGDELKQKIQELLKTTTE